MNVHCQSCETVYRIDPLKIPETGVRARCTICSNVIEVNRSSEEEAPATARPMTPHAPSQADRLAHQLGDAFIPAPADDEDPSDADGLEETIAVAPTDDESDAGPIITETPEVESEQDLAARRRKSVESMPGIIMPPEEDELPAAVEPLAPPQPFSAPRVTPAPSVSPPPTPAIPEDVSAPRVSRPFSLPRDIAPAEPGTDRTVPPVRPTAPVFRPTPGRPVQSPTTAPPARPRAPTPPTPSVPSSAPAKPINPFLSRDPGQKARRLARALISDMIVYQPDKRQRALQDGNLAEVFDEEIKKSWEEYVEQVGEEMANSTTYFTDALNDLLADGDKVF